MRKLSAMLFFPLMIALALGACSSDDPKQTTDGPVTGKDGGPTPGKDGAPPAGDQGPITPPPAELDCTGDKCADFVFDTLKLPASTEDAKKYGVDFDNNGTPDNQLGQILNALGSIVPDLALQPSVDAAVNEGKTIILARVQGGDFKAAAKAAARAWLGKEVKCCTDVDPVKCAAETKQTCFKGDYEFEPENPAEKMMFGGSITGGVGKFGPSMMTINLPLSTGALKLVLQSAQFEVKFDGGKITEGKLAGAITEKDLNEGVLPSVAAMLQNTVETSSGKTKEQILQLFDQPPTGNGDGKITLEEVQNNDIIKAFLQGDVDIDKDGKMELSLGVGFTAVGAKIKVQ